MAEMADAADLKSAGEILVGSNPSPGTRLSFMVWLVIIIGYLIGTLPTAYLAGRILRGEDIRFLGDGNMGAANAYRELGARVGISVGVIDAGKGALAVYIAQVSGMPLTVVLITGTAAVVGHNWPFILGFRGGRGEATAIGVLTMLIPQPIFIIHSHEPDGIWPRVSRSARATIRSSGVVTFMFVYEPRTTMTGMPRSPMYRTNASRSS